jgi:hypothetical protein
MKIYHLYYFAIMLVMLGCEKSAIISPSNKKAICFQVSYANFAWGKHFNGFMVDNSGNIYVYKTALKYDIDKNGRISEGQMNENLTQTVLSKTTIIANELTKYASLIGEISTKSYSKKISVGADMGGITYLAYKYNESEKIYESVLLAERGDWEMYNKDTNAIEIVKWLREFETKVL